MSAWLTVKQAAEKANFCPEWIRRLLRNGQLAGVKKGVFWYVNANSLDNYLEQTRTFERRGRPRKKGKHDKAKEKP